MKKLLGVFAVLAALAVPTYGISYNDYDIFGNEGLDGIAISSGGGSVTGTFDIVNWDGGLLDNVGYNPAAETIVSANARFALGAVGFGTRYYDIDIGTDDFADGSFGVFILGFKSETGDLTGNVSLSTTGAVDYTVTNNSRRGTFSLLWAKLDVETRKSGGATVPDSGATLALLGLGMMGLFIARKRALK